MQFKQLRVEAWKSQDFNGVWTCDLAHKIYFIPILCFMSSHCISFFQIPYYQGELITFDVVPSKLTFSVNYKSVVLKVRNELLWDIQVQELFSVSFTEAIIKMEREGKAWEVMWICILPSKSFKHR